MEETGDLIIRHVLANDEGKYQCVAHNMAATRESPAISLSVYGKFLLFSTCLSSHSVFSKKKFLKKKSSRIPSLSLSLISFIYSVQTTFSSFSLSLSLKSFASISHARLDPPSLPFSMACDRVEVVRSRHYIHHLTGPGNFLPCSVVRWQIISTTPDSFTLH